MSSPRPTKSPKKPILIPKTTKVNPKSSQTGLTSSTPRKNLGKTQTPSPRTEVPAIRPLSQRERQMGVMQEIKSSQGLESPRSPRNTNSKPMSPSQSGQFSPKKDNEESLRRQIRDQSKFSLKQSQLIKKLHANLARAEIVTGNAAPNSTPNDTTNQFSNLELRLDYLIDNYISQNEKLKKLEALQNENQPNNALNETNQLALDNQRIVDAVKAFYINNQDSNNYPEQVGRDLDLSKKVRDIFNQVDNDEAILRTIQSNKETANDNAKVDQLSSQIQQLSGNEGVDQNEVVQNLNRQHKQDIEEKDAQINELNQALEQSKKEIEEQNNQIQNLNLTLDNNNKERTEQRENLERELNKKAEELRNAYKQIEEKGIETDQQRRDRDLSSRVRDIFPNDHDEKIPEFIRKDIGLASTIRGIYQSGDDGYITEDIRKSHQEGPQAQEQINNLRNELELKQNAINQKDGEIYNLRQSSENEINNLRNDATEKQRLIDQKADELRELSQNHQNKIDGLQNEINNLKNEVNQKQLQIEQKDKELSEISQSHQREIEQKENLLNDLKQQISSNSDDLGNQVVKLKEEIVAKTNELDQKAKELADFENQIERLRNELSQQKIDSEQRENELFNKYKLELDQKQLAIDSLNEQIGDPNNEKNKEIESLKTQLVEALGNQKEENTTKPNENTITISKEEYEKLQDKLHGFIENANKTKEQANMATQKIEELIKENEALKLENKEFINDSEANLINFKKQNEETLNFANQVRSLFDNNIPAENYASLRDNDKEIVELIKHLKGPQQSQDLYEEVGRLFHQGASNEQIKAHTQKVAAAAKTFHELPLAKDALDDLFKEASGEQLEDLVRQMRNDPDEAVRENAKILSDALKDSRMTVEAEGMITTALAMFLQQMGKEASQQ